MKHFESMKYMEESLNTRQNHYMKHSIVIFFSVFFLGDNAASQKSWGVPRFSHVASEGLISRDFSWLVGVGDFAETQEMFWVCFFSPGVIFSIATGKEHPPPTVFSTLFTMKKKETFFPVSFLLYWVGPSTRLFFFQMFNGQPSFLAPKIRVSRGGKPSTSIGCYECREGPSCLYNHLASELPQKGAPRLFVVSRGGIFFDFGRCSWK